MSVYDHPSTLELAGHDDDPAVRQHLAACVACRVRAARLWHEVAPGEPAHDVVTRILEASSPGPAILASFSTERDAGLPRPGDIWRIGRNEPILGWVRQVFSDAIDIIPVVLDIELADQESVFLAPESTPLGMPLALLTGIRGHVGPRALLQRIGYVHAFAAVKEVMAAARDGRMPDGVTVGPPIESDDDQRVEYRQVIADLLADLGPDTWTDDGPPGPELAELLSAELSFLNSGAHVRPLSLHQEPLSGEASLFACARVTYLDTSLVVAALAGAGLDEALGSPSALAGACLNLARLEPDAAAIAVTSRAGGRLAGDWPAVVLKVADLRTAYETPTGRVMEPRIAREPLPVADAVVKYLDSQAPAWEVTEPVTTRIDGIDIAAIAGRSAADAVADVRGQYRRARTPAKKSAGGLLPADLAARVAEGIEAILAGEQVERVLDELAGQDETERGD
jgi:hypothetical protein